MGLNKQTIIPLKSRPSLLLFIRDCYATSTIGMQHILLGGHSIRKGLGKGQMKVPLAS